MFLERTYVPHTSMVFNNYLSTNLTNVIAGVFGFLILNHIFDPNEFQIKVSFKIFFTNSLS